MSRILNSKIFSVFLLFFVFWIGNSLVNLNRQREDVNQKLDVYESKTAEAKKSNDNLAGFLKNIENQAFLEREAKIKHNYKKSDENVVFVYSDNNSKTASQGFDELLKSIPVWKKFFYKIGNFNF